jgi:glycosyltransferase involved in cell wall biosynthesis
MPTYNRCEIIKDTIKSVLDQIYVNWELIIVDDGSNDDTFSVLESFSKLEKRISFYKRPSSLRKGANSCRNYGLLKSRGELIKWIDSDDLLPPYSLINQVNVFKLYDNVSMCLGYGKFLDDGDNSINSNWSRNSHSNNYFSDHIINNIRWPIGGIMWKRKILDVNPFDESLSNSQEWLMHSIYLLKLNSDQIFNLKDVNYYIRRGHDRISSSFSYIYYFNQLKARLILIKHFKSINYNDIFQLMKQILVYFYYSIFYFCKNFFR